MEQQGKQKGKRTRRGFYRDSLVIHIDKNEVSKEVKLRGRLVTVMGNPDGSNHWEFMAIQALDPNPTCRGEGKKAPMRDIAYRSMSQQKGSIRLVSPRGAAVERAGLLALAFLMGAAIYKNLSHFFGF